MAVRTSASNQAGAYSLTFEFIPSETFVHALYFAQFANGSGFTTQINLLSLNESQPTHARMTVRDDDGNLLDLLENDTAGEAAQEMTIPASGLLVLRTTGVGELKSGAVLIESDQPLAGTIVFGGDFGLAGVDSSPLIRDRFLAPVEVNQQRQTNTGVALQNLEERSTALTFELLNSSGTVVASATGSSLKAGGHRAFFVDELNWNRSIDFRSFEGVLRVLPQGRISASVLLTRPGQLASLPVVVP